MNEEVFSVNKLPNHRWKVLIIGGLPAAAVLMRSAYALTNAQLGIVFSIMALGVAISELPWGVLTDKLGDRPVLLTGLCGSGLVMFLMSIFALPGMGYVSAVIPLALCLFFLGLLGSSVNGSSGRAIMSWFTDSERGFAMSIRQTAVPMGYGLGALLFPLIASNFGFVAIYSFSCAALLICAFLTWIWLYEPKDKKKSDLQLDEDNRAKSPLKRLSIWKIVSAIGVLCGPQFILLMFGAIFLHDFGHVSVFVSSVTLAIVQIGAMISRVWGGRWTDKNKNRRQYLKACSILSVLAFVALTASESALSMFVEPGSLIFSYTLIGLFIMSGILVSAWHGVAYTELAGMAGPKYVGTALAMGNTVVFIVMFIVPLIVPYLTENFSWTFVWILSVASCVYAYAFFPSVLVKNNN